MAKKNKKSKADDPITSHWGDLYELLRGRDRIEVMLAAVPVTDPDEKLWLVTSHDNDWDQVGTFMSTAEILQCEPTLLCRRYEEAPPRSQALVDANELITGDRNETYGTPTQNFTNIAAFWNVQFGHMLADGAQFTAANVAQANALQKLARMIAQPKPDNWIDLAGYAACGYECENPA